MRESLDNVNLEDPWRRVVRDRLQSSRIRSMIMGRRLAARGVASSSAGTSIPHGPFSGADVAEPRRSLARAFGTPEAVVGRDTAAIPIRASRGKSLVLEEPYIIQPTATVFQKLFDLLVRSLRHLQGDADTDKASTTSTVLSLLQIMRANFCRLVDAHVDPAEVGLVLDNSRQRHFLEKATKARRSLTEGEKLLPNILQCLQGIMLQQKGDPLLLRATVDTFTSGLPLLMPRIEDRLHLLLELVWHLQSNGSKCCDLSEELSSAKGLSEVVAPSEHGMASGLAHIPRERVSLLRDLLKHFARTESVLELLTLFEENKAERHAVSDLLELMLLSMADKACPRAGTIPQLGEGSWLEGSNKSPPQALPRLSKSYWVQLVADGAGGTTLNFTLLDTFQQHLLCMVLNRDKMDESPHDLLLCQYGQCLLQVTSLVLCFAKRKLQRNFICFSSFRLLKAELSY